MVAGIRTPQHLTKQARQRAEDDTPSMEEVMPVVFGELVEVYQRLEAHYRDMQDIEFTVQRQKLYMLQTRAGKRTAKAAIKIAVDMQREGLIDEAEAVGRIDPASLDQLLHPTLDPEGGQADHRHRSAGQSGRRLRQGGVQRRRSGSESIGR